MQLTNAVCYALFTITLTATCIQADDHSPDNTEENNTEKKRITKRQASAIFIDSFPSESGFEPKNKVIYRRVTRIPYRTSRPKYAPKRTKPAKSKRPVKQKRSRYQPSRLNYKYSPPKGQKKRPPKSKPRGRQPIHVKPSYSVPKHRPQRQPSMPYRPPEPTGFAEPPVEYQINHGQQNFAQNRPTFNDPPVDSYGAPLTSPTGNDYYSQGYSMDNDEPGHVHNQLDGFQNWENDQHNVEPNYAFTKKRPTFVQPEAIDDVIKNPHLDYQDFNNYADPYKQDKAKLLKVQKHFNRPWTAAKVYNKPRDHVIVGGQYAEPPGRYVAKYPPLAHPQALAEEEAPFGPLNGLDSDTSGSAPISSYVNYKNSNMAFSPQNLNDAFSIVD